MKLVCNVYVGNRLLPALGINKARKHVKSTLALCKHPKAEEFCILLFSNQSKNGTKYSLKGNIMQILTRFVNEGKATIQFTAPPHDLFIQSDVIQLKGFLHVLKRALENKISSKELTYSSMSVTPSSKDVAPKKLVITKRSEYPAKGFPRTLEILIINDINRCSLDRGILNLIKLRVLDLSNNCIEYLPEEFNKLPSLKELHISHNNLGKATLNQWNWMGGNLSKSLFLLNLNYNDLKILPNQLIKLQHLTTLHSSHNQLTTLPSGIGNLRHLKIFSASNNTIQVLPGSAKKLRLESLDLSDNAFETSLQNGPPAVSPKPLQVCTLKEYAARKVLNARLSYNSETLPHTVIDYLDNAKYCVCGKACFHVYIRHRHMWLLSNIAQSIQLSSHGVTYVPMDCFFCSSKCFSSTIYNRNRNPIVR